MNLVRLKRLITLLLIGSHIVSFLWLFVLFLIGGYAFDDFTTAVALMMPLFAGYTTMIVKDSIAEAAPDAAPMTDRMLPWSFSTLVLVFTGSFAVYLLLILTLKGFNLAFSSFDQFKVLLGASETVFGVYVGYLLPTLFSNATNVSLATPAATSPAGAIGDAGNRHG